ncbi:flagellin, partial [Paracoccaceae bacterium]|nr:flagellin [Paracoccaceae bacterium]
MANIGTTTAFYKVETSLTRANTEVSKSMERLATGRQNANAGDRSSYVAMSDTFRMDFVGTKAGIKGGSVVMGYLETGMRVLDAASSLLSRLQELAVLGANNTNTTADHDAINAEAEALGDEFNRLMSTSKYKGKDVFVTTAGSEYVSMGGRDAEMTFGIGSITYTELYGSARTISYTGGPSNGSSVNLVHLPSDAVDSAPVTVASLQNGVTYEITDVTNLDATSKGEIVTASNLTAVGEVVNGATFTVTGTTDVAMTGSDTFEGRALFSDAANTFTTLQIGAKYEIATVGTLTTAAKTAIVNASDLTANSQVVAGATFTASSNVADLDTGKAFTGKLLTATGTLTSDIEAVQAKINTARVQAGSQYAAIESAINYTTDLTAQYELGFNTVNDVNFSMET